MKDASEKATAAGRVKGFSIEEAQHALSLQLQEKMQELGNRKQAWRCPAGHFETTSFDPAYRQPYGCRVPGCLEVLERA